jgi:hypothetical protein
MTLAIILVVTAVSILGFILWSASKRSIQIASKTPLANQLQPLDLQAFRNLSDPAESEYLRRRLPAREFRSVQRQRLIAMLAYIAAARQNAGILIRMAESAKFSGDTQTVAAAHQLVENAQLLRINAAVASCWIYAAYVWPTSKLGTAPIVHGYEQVSGSAMLLGRLQNPTSPVRLSATS